MSQANHTREGGVYDVRGQYSRLSDPGENLFTDHFRREIYTLISSFFGARDAEPSLPVLLPRQGSQKRQTAYIFRESNV